MKTKQSLTEQEWSVLKTIKACSNSREECYSTCELDDFQDDFTDDKIAKRVLKSLIKDDLVWADTHDHPIQDGSRTIFYLTDEGWDLVEVENTEVVEAENTEVVETKTPNIILTDDVNFDVNLTPAYHSFKDTMIEIPDTALTVRQDNGEVLGIVSPHYGLVDHKEVIQRTAEAISRVSNNFSVKHIVDGPDIYSQFVLNDRMIMDNVANEGACLAIDLTMNYDGSLATSIEGSIIRLVCENGMLSSSGAENIFSKYHTGNIDVEQIVQHIEPMLIANQESYTQLRNMLVDSSPLSDDFLGNKIGKEFVKKAIEEKMDEEVMYSNGDYNRWTQLNVMTNYLKDYNIGENGRQMKLQKIFGVFSSSITV